MGLPIYEDSERLANSDMVEERAGHAARQEQEMDDYREPTTTRPESAANTCESPSATPLTTAPENKAHR